MLLISWERIGAAYPNGISYSRHTALDNKDFHISSWQPSFAGHYLTSWLLSSVTHTLIKSTADSIRGWLWWLFTSFILPAS